MMYDHRSDEDEPPNADDENKPGGVRPVIVHRPLWRSARCDHYFDWLDQWYIDEKKVTRPHSVRIRRPRTTPIKDLDETKRKRPAASLPKWIFDDHDDPFLVTAPQ